MYKIYYLIIIFFIANIKTEAQNLYFPPNGSSDWDTLSATSLGWCTSEINNLYNYLDSINSKSFIVLKEGKIVLEKYFDGFEKDSLWYWASAAKTVTSFLVGIAQQEGKLSLSDTSSTYLGIGWTNCSTEQEKKITIQHQLTMTSGLDDEVADNHCTLDSCLIYKADAGTRWAYHNAPYTLLDKVLQNATGQTLNALYLNKLRNPIGMNGAFFPMDYDNLLITTPRSMARFGLLILNKGKWNGNQILTDTNYFNQMTNTSQNINLSYGYLWWLNGKTSCMVPETQLVFPFSICPDGPPDMIAALGKNGQIINIVPSQNLVFIRMGDMPGTGDVPFTLNNEIWKRLNLVICNTSVNESNDRNEVIIYPNPTSGKIYITHNFNSFSKSFFKLYTIFGEEIINIALTDNNQSIDLRHLKKGIYFSKILTNEKNISTQKIIIR